MKTTRRKFLQFTGVAAGASMLLGPKNAFAAAIKKDSSQQYAMLHDTTRCIGCQACERACCEKNGFPLPEKEPEIGSQRNTGPQALTVVNAGAAGDKGSVFCKTQCMHCDQPACVSACLVNAMYKTEEGPVIWREDKCMGCRYCMVSCPFDVPKFEYDSPVPKIQKCQLCWSRLQEGERPACVSNCPAGALKFGKRRELLDEARDRIYHEPDKYVHEIYGEHEVGGTSWLYLSAVPFEQLGLPTHLGETPFPVYTREFLYAVPLVLTLAPPFLLALNRASRAREVAEEEGEGGEA